MEDKLLEAAVEAIGSAFKKDSKELSVPDVKKWFEDASGSVGVTGHVDLADVEKLTQAVLGRGTPLLDAEVPRRNLARWFEIPQEEFNAPPASQLEPVVLIRHLCLEEMFKDWFKEWGYAVEVGEDLEGLESIDFTPDVYGQLRTLHGHFEIGVNFVCDTPPSQYRVGALLDTLEAYATESSDFKWGDIYILATPFQFGKGSASRIRLQSKQEKYAVIKLEGDDIYELQCARDAEARLAQLLEHVEKARAIGPSQS